MKFFDGSDSFYNFLAILTISLMVSLCITGVSLYVTFFRSPPDGESLQPLSPSPSVVEPTDQSHEVVLRFILQHEGPGVQKEVGHGGYSYRGITQESWAEWRAKQGDKNHLPADVRAAAEVMVKRFYYDYFDGYKVWNLHPALQLIYADFSVLSGHHATKDIQRLVGAHADGIWGSETSAAVAAFNATLTTPEARHAAFNRLDVMKRKFLMWLGEHPEHKRDLAGWIKRAEDLRTYMQPYL